MNIKIEFIYFLAIIHYIQCAIMLNATKTVQFGTVVPAQVLTVKGQLVHIRLPQIGALGKKYESCTIVKPDSSSEINLNEEKDPFVKYWGSGLDKGDCGATIGPIDLEHEGRWYLKAIYDDNKIIGTSNIILRELPKINNNTIIMEEGEIETIGLDPEESNYCEVTGPMYEANSQVIQSGCELKFDKATRTDSGIWTAKVAIQGSMKELTIQKNITVNVEKIITGFQETKNSITLYCNIIHTHKNVTFCRFKRISDDFGLSLMPGISDEKYSYYGNGFERKECGMLINNPTRVDRGPWKCMLGYKGDKNNGTMSSIVQTLSASTYSKPAVKVPDMVVSLNGSSLTVTCKVESSLRYCWWTHPNKTVFAPIPGRKNDKSIFWYTGESRLDGDCGLTINQSNLMDSGEWTCHLGMMNQIEEEITATVKVTVSLLPLIAKNKLIFARLNSKVTLQCTSVPIGMPLDYCRFVPPDGQGFALTDDVNKENAIRGQYWYGGKGLLTGDCSVTINIVKKEHYGNWTCAGASIGFASTEEGRDTFSLSPYLQKQVAGLSTASAAGIAIGVIAAVAIVGVMGFMQYRRYRRDREQQARPQIVLRPYTHRTSSEESVSNPGRLSTVSS